eukprot:6036256-Amphidinium_carterae.1
MLRNKGCRRVHFKRSKWGWPKEVGGVALFYFENKPIQSGAWGCCQSSLHWAGCCDDKKFGIPFLRALQRLGYGRCDASGGGDGLPLSWSTKSKPLGETF